MYTYMNTHIHTYICIHTYTHTHTLWHRHRQQCGDRGKGGQGGRNNPISLLDKLWFVLLLGVCMFFKSPTIIIILSNTKIVLQKMLHHDQADAVMLTSLHQDKHTRSALSIRCHTYNQSLAHTFTLPLSSVVLISLKPIYSYTCA